jgi:hypothetical protein
VHKAVWTLIVRFQAVAVPVIVENRHFEAADLEAVDARRRVPAGDALASPELPEEACRTAGFLRRLERVGSEGEVVQPDRIQRASRSR